MRKRKIVVTLLLAFIGTAFILFNEGYRFSVDVILSDFYDYHPDAEIQIKKDLGKNRTLYALEYENYYGVETPTPFGSVLIVKKDWFLYKNINEESYSGYYMDGLDAYYIDFSYIANNRVHYLFKTRDDVEVKAFEWHGYKEALVELPLEKTREGFYESDTSYGGFMVFYKDGVIVEVLEGIYGGHRPGLMTYIHPVQVTLDTKDVSLKFDLDPEDPFIIDPKSGIWDQEINTDNEEPLTTLQIEGREEYISASELPEESRYFVQTYEFFDRGDYIVSKMTNKSYEYNVEDESVGKFIDESEPEYIITHPFIYEKIISDVQSKAQ